MKIAIDYDECYTENPEFFDGLEGEMFMITGRPDAEIKELKDELGSYYTIIGYPKGWPKHEAMENDEIVKCLKDIADWKAKMVKELGIEIYYDDDYRLLKVIKDKNPSCLCFLVI